MKNLFKHILFGAAIFAGMGLFVGCDTMTDDEIEKLINDKLNENSSNATADATPPVELAGTTWFHYEEGTRSEFDEDLGEIIEYEVYEEYFLHFTETTAIFIDKTYKKEDDSLLNEWEQTGGYYVQGNIIIPFFDEGGWTVVYDKQKNCLYISGLKFNLVEE